ncbi:hypothetical protein [Zavarzinella formosa]|uniref:hypothetical protein n=1 Tax=Zavarzinella formosa TaxID=360055 RepID=UPI0012FCAE7D|nr:hypothetical protein [Zavarzinella formosa]
MKKIITTHVGDNGVLNVSMPFSMESARKAVRVTVETLEEPASSVLPADRDSWLRFIERTVGSVIDPTFERHPQGELEERETFA